MAYAPELTDPVRRHRRMVPAMVAFMLPVVFSVVATLLARSAVDRQIEERLHLQGEALVTSIQHGVESVQEHLEAVAGLFAASTEVTPGDYERFASEVGLGPGMGGVAYIPVIPAEELRSFEERMASLIPGYTVFEVNSAGDRVSPAPRDTYFPVQYFEPREALGQPLGLDAGSPPGRLPHILEAIRTGRSVATPLVSLVPTGDQGFVIYVPITDDSGVGALATGPVVLTELMEAVVPPGLANSLDWTIADVTETGIPQSAKDSFFYSSTVEVANRQWAFDIVPAEGSPLLGGYFPEYWILVAGLLMGLAAATVAHNFVRESAARRKVEVLTETLEAKDKFVATVSHELRTPLTGVLGYAEVLRDPEAQLTPAERTELAAFIADEARDLGDIIEDLLVMNRAEHGTLTTVAVTVDLKAQTAQVLETMGLAERVPLTSQGDTVRAVGDPGRIRQILRNLMTNAQRYGGPNIRVVVAPTGEEMRVAIIDDGAGIPPGQETTVFEAYHRAHDIVSSPGPVGLGLSVSRTLARIMGGTLEYSRRDGETIFTLTLKAAPRPTDLAEDLPGRDRAGVQYEAA